MAFLRGWHVIDLVSHEPRPFVETEVFQEKVIICILNT